jgi:hypothetical protein
LTGNSSQPLLNAVPMVGKCLQKPQHRPEILHRCGELTVGGRESRFGMSTIATRIK